MGQFRWLTVESRKGTDGVELVLEPMGFPPARTYQKALFDAFPSRRNGSLHQRQNPRHRLVFQKIDRPPGPSARHDGRLAVAQKTTAELKTTAALGIHESVTPGIMCKRCGIELLPMEPPLRQVLVHNREETIIVMFFNQMRQFVDNNIFQTPYRLLCKL